MLQKRDERCCRRHNLVRRNVHVLDNIWLYHRKISAAAATNRLVDKVALVVDRRVCLGNHGMIFLLRREELNVFRDLAVLDHAIRRFDEAVVVDAGVHTEGRNETDVRALRSLNRAETAVVCVVNVTHLEAGTFTRQTTWAKRGQTSLVCQFGQRVRLVHELAKLVRTEERIDDARYGTGIDQILGREFVGIAQVHTLLDGTRHASHTKGELGSQLFAYRADAAVAEVVNVIDIALAILQADQLAYDGDDVIARKGLKIFVLTQPQTRVDTVAANLTQIVSFIGEEKAFQDTARRVLIGRLGAAKLQVEVLQRFLLRVRRIFFEGVDQRGFIQLVLFRLFADEVDFLNPCLFQRIVIGLCQLMLSREDDLPFDALFNDFSRILVHHLGHALDRDRGSKPTADSTLEGFFRLARNGIGQIEELYNLLIAGIPKGAQQCGDGKLLFPVDVGPHHVAYIRGKLNPGAPEWDYTGGVQIRPVRVLALPEENTRGTMQLRHHDALSTVDDERTTLCHKRQVAQVDLLLNGFFRFILVLVLLCRKAQLGLEGHREGKALSDAFLDGVLRSIQSILDELERVALTAVVDREVLVEHRLKSRTLPLFRGNMVLYEVVERLQLDVQKIRVVLDGLDARERGAHGLTLYLGHGAVSYR